MTNRKERDQTVLELQAVAAASRTEPPRAAAEPWGSVEPPRGTAEPSRAQVDSPRGAAEPSRAQVGPSRAPGRPPWAPANQADSAGATATATESLEREPLRSPREPMRSGPPPDRRRLGRSPWLGFGVAAVAALVVAGLTFAISSALPATYKASTQLRVTVDGSNGLGQDSVLGGNQLTAQLVQLAPTDAVLNLPAAGLGMSTSQLRSALSVGSVAQQNILDISATGSSPGEAEQRASAVTAGLLAFLAKDARSQRSAYHASVTRAIAGMDNQLAQLGRTTGKISPTQLGVVQGEAGAIAGQAQAIRSQLAQHDATSVPAVQQIQGADTASKVTPKPLLYAVVALLVAGFIAVQLVSLSQRRARGL